MFGWNTMAHIVKLNNKCNSNCVFCADSKEERQKPDPELSKLLSGLQDADTLIITGGEPTIYPHLQEFLQQVQNRYNDIMLCTNGFLLAQKENVAKLKGFGITKIQISYLTNNPEMYYKTTGIKNSYKYVLSAIENCKSLGLTVSINTVIFRHNYTNLPEIVKELIDLEVDNIQLSFLNPTGTSIVDGKSKVMVRLSDVKPYINEAFEYAEALKFDNLFVENIPICIIPHLKDRISDLQKPEENKDYYNACKRKPDKPT